MSRRLASGTSRRSLVSDTTQVLPSFFPPRQLLLSHQSSVLSKIIYIFLAFMQTAMTVLDMILNMVSG